jgi:hypothetical protein
LGGVNRGSKGFQDMARKIGIKRDIITKMALNTSLKKKRFRVILMPESAYRILFLALLPPKPV